MQLADSAAFVTGAASGLGEATARALSAGGSTVIVADRDDNKGLAVASAIGGIFVHTDVTDEESMTAALAVAHDTGLPLRVAVACAGIGPAARTVARDGTPHDAKTYRLVIDVNLVGTFNLLRLAAAEMASTSPTADGDRGVIVTTASVAAFEGQIGQLAYSASKGGVVGMTLPAARDLAAVGIRVCTIAPGLFDTPLLASLPESARVGLAKDVVYPGRLGRPDEYAALVRAIVDIGYLNGEVIRLDGGIRMPPK
ncbi:MAG: 3-hydroxyacyl-CoA dehydrogenase (short-chain) [Acidimicrobiia bacterium]|nr:3-hydroxyacyl-CoA dehydrogenase (short-chain) [Acidimicrobiia bacterium]